MERETEEKIPNPPFKMLSFDTSTSNLHIALSRNGDIVSQEIISVASGVASDRHVAVNRLIPSMDRLLKSAHWSKHDLDALVVGTGPGSFTAIRTTVVIARSLAQALNLPLIAISLLDCYAPFVETSGAIILDAERGAFFLGIVENGSLSGSYVHLNQLEAKVHAIDNVYADDKAIKALSVQTGNLGITNDLRTLPNISNIAVHQSHLAWDRLSLKLSDLYETLKHNVRSNNQDMEQIGTLLGCELRRQFPYQSVSPTYLRSPSVTIKKANV